jgi:hypothetical protein
MIADIVKSHDGSWCVIGHLSSGDAHDFFESQSEAVAFAQVFYNATVEVVEARRTPQTTWAQCKEHGASWESCDCKDFRFRGGSHRDENGDRVCKHILHVRKEFRLGMRVVKSVGG